MDPKDYYPAGAYDDTNAPYNEAENPEIELGVLCSQTLSRSVPCITNDYTCDREEVDEDGNIVPVNVNTSETCWEDVYAENDYRTPLQLIELFKKFLSNKLIGDPPMPESPSFLKHLIKDCEGWIEDETVVMEDE